LGGYRPWRPDMVRFDNMIPFTLGLFYFYLATSWHVIQYIRVRKWLYGIALSALLIHFTLIDLPTPFTTECEVRSMRIMAGSSEEVVALPGRCHLLSWHIIADPGESILQGELLWRWRILDQPKQFHFEE
jgi:hypothetical protein